MKRIHAALMLVYIFAMVGLTMLGSFLRLEWLSLLGIIMLFAGAVLISLIYTIVVMVRVSKNSGRQKNGKPDGEDITDKIIDENGEVNITAYAEHEIGNAVSEYKASSRKEKIFSIVLIVTLLACLIGGVVSFVFNKIVGGVLIGAFVLIIISCIIVISIKQRIAMSGKGVRENAPVNEATVIACTVSSRTTVMGRTTVVYKVRLDLGGVKKVTYSKNYYCEGETVSVRGDRYDKRIALVDDGKRHTPYPSYQNYIDDSDEDTDDSEAEDYDAED